MERSSSERLLSHSRNVIKIGKYLYDQREIPRCVRLFGDILTPSQEEDIIRIFNPKYPNLPEDLKSINTLPGVAELTRRMMTQFKDFIFNVADIIPSDKITLYAGKGILSPTDQNNWKSDGVSVSLNLGSDCVMLFRKKGDSKIYRVLVPRRSLLVVKDPYLEYERRVDSDAETMYQASPYLDPVLIIRTYRYVLAWVISLDSTKLKYEPPSENEFGIFQPIQSLIDIDVNQQMNMSEQEVQRRIAQTSIEDFVNTLMDLPLWFPYMKYSMQNDPSRQFDTLYRNLKDFKYTSRIDTRLYTELPGIQNKNKDMYDYSFPFGSSKSLTVVSLPEDFNRIDCITNYFTEDARMTAKVNKNRFSQPVSPYEYWVTDWRKNIFISLIKKKQPITSETLREEIYFQVPEATLFKVSFSISVIRILHSHIQSIDGSLHMLDISSGWGDRLISSFASGCGRYLGFDPNTKLIPGHRDIISKLGSSETHMEIRPEPFETAQLEGEMFDLCFTSPPYFSFEIYTSENTQSISKYPKYETWLNHFLLASIRKAWEALRPGGALAVHLSDTKEMPNVCSILCLYIEGFLMDSRYGGVISSQLREKDDDENSGKIRRPVWIFFKNKQVSSLTSTRAAEAKKRFKKYYHWLYKQIQLKE
jgi:hypothetical protein